MFRLLEFIENRSVKRTVDVQTANNRASCSKRGVVFLSSLSRGSLEPGPRRVFRNATRLLLRSTGFLFEFFGRRFLSPDGGGRGGRPSANAFAKASFVRLFRKISAAHIRGSFTISERRTCVVVSTRLVDKMPERPRGGPGFYSFRLSDRRSPPLSILFQKKFHFVSFWGAK